MRNIKENTRWWAIEKSDYVPLAFSPRPSDLSSYSTVGFVFFLNTVHAFVHVCQIQVVSLGTAP